MLSFLPASIRGALAGILFLINIVIIAILIIITGLIEMLIPIKAVKKVLNDIQQDVFPSVWTDFNKGILKLLTRTQWEVHGNSELHRDHWYFLVANHRTWADIVIMQIIFNRKIPLLKFFLKKELLWSLPLGGLACWMLDYPFMQRYSKAYLKKHPEKKNKDLETTHEACIKFERRPTTVVNFLEGTRFTNQKRIDRSSPYQHLLRPKAGGFAYVISEMKDYIKELINVTLVYSHPEPTFWNFLSGKITKIIVYYEVIPLKPELYGDYYNDQAFRRQFQAWVNGLWQEKDKLIQNTLEHEKKS